MTYNEYATIQIEKENLRLLEENNRLDFELSQSRRETAEALANISNFNTLVDELEYSRSLLLKEVESLKQPALVSRRFKLEEAIMNCWTIMDDVDTLYKTVGDTDKLDDLDALMNYILGLHSIGSVKFGNLFDLYEDMVNNGEIK